jgi:hypothetical protein
VRAGTTTSPGRLAAKYEPAGQLAVRRWISQKRLAMKKKIRFYSGGGPRNGRQHTSIAHRERRRILLNKRLMSFNWHRIPRFENQRLARF